MNINEKHLEFLQNNISRMNKCSFQMKGRCITIVSAFIAIYVSSIGNYTNGNKLFIYIAIAPTLLFWILDSLYLSNERKLIGIYNDVINQTTFNSELKIKEFEIPLHKYKGWRYSIMNAIISLSEILFYGSIIIGLILFGVLI